MSFGFSPETGTMSFPLHAVNRDAHWIQFQEGPAGNQQPVSHCSAAQKKAASIEPNDDRAVTI